MGTGDLFTAAAILAVAGWILYRSLLGKKGGCHGCSGCSHAGAKDGASSVVRIGAPIARRRGAGSGVDRSAS
jgi:hypothetical protein